MLNFLGCALGTVSPQALSVQVTGNPTLSLRLAEVTVTHHDGQVVVEVTDNGRAGSGGVLGGRAAPDGPGNGNGVGSGQGILGMRERARALGGSLEAGPRPGGGFRVQATLPVAAP